MRFADTYILFKLVLILPVLFMFYLWALRKKRAVLDRFAQKDLLDSIAPSYGRDRIWLRIFMTLLAVFLMTTAIARPQWGFFWKEKKQEGLDILIAIDVSKSMMAVDVKPNRLYFAKKEVGDFVETLHGDRVGLIAFSGYAFLQCPLTLDYRGLLLALNALDVDTISRGGTSIPGAVEEAVKSYKGAAGDNKVLIIITDGENTEGDIQTAIDQARREKMMICTIGIGSKEGELIQMPDETGKITYLKDKDGRQVRSRLMEKTLENISEKTGGLYVRASSFDLGLRKIYEDRLSVLEKKETETKKVKVFKERYQYPAVLALIFLMMEMILGSTYRKKDDGKI